MPSDTKKWITARCYTAVQLEGGVAIFKEDTQTQH
jgi:hypothetical protein